MRHFIQHDEKLLIDDLRREIEFLHEENQKLQNQLDIYNSPEEPETELPFHEDLESNSVEAQFNGPGDSYINISMPLGDKWGLLDAVRSLMVAAYA